jgi:hypothetical protein
VDATLNGREELAPAALTASATFHGSTESRSLHDANARPWVEKAGLATADSIRVRKSCAAARLDKPSASAISASRPARRLPPCRWGAPGGSRPRRFARSGSVRQTHRTTTRMNLGVGILAEVSVTSSVLASRRPCLNHSRSKDDRSPLKKDVPFQRANRSRSVWEWSRSQREGAGGQLLLRSGAWRPDVPVVTPGRRQDFAGL